MPIGYGIGYDNHIWICNGTQITDAYLTDEQKDGLMDYVEDNRKKPRQLQLFKAFEMQRKRIIAKIMKEGAE